MKSKKIKIYGILSTDWLSVFEQCRRVYRTDAVAPTLTTFDGGGHEIKIAICKDREKYVHPEEEAVEDQDLDRH